MITWALLVGLFNLALGYAVAAALADPPPWAAWTALLARRTNSGALRPKRDEAIERASNPAPASAPAGKNPTESDSVVVATLEELPQRWREQLTLANIPARSYVEGLAQVMRLELSRYREQLLTAESRARANLATRDAGALRLVADDLQFVNHDWLDKQAEAAGMLLQWAGRLAEHEELARGVEQALLDQAAHVGSASGFLEALEFEEDPETKGKQLLEKVAGLIDAAHGLRDRLLECLALLLRADNQLESLTAEVQLDHITALPNRVGAEALLESWWREDPQRERPLSIALLDVDRFARVNERLGTRGGDRAVAAVSRLMGEMIRRDRGYDRLARVGGQTFLMLLGDTAPRNGLIAVERTRQAIEAATFDDDGAELELTVSGGVVGVGRTDTVLDVLRHAQQALRTAKKAGPNRSAVDEGTGPLLLPPAQLTVKGRVLHLGGE